MFSIMIAIMCNDNDAISKGIITTATNITDGDIGVYGLIFEVNNKHFIIIMSSLQVFFDFEVV